MGAKLNITIGNSKLQVKPTDELAEDVKKLAEELFDPERAKWFYDKWAIADVLRITIGKNALSIRVSHQRRVNIPYKEGVDGVTAIQKFMELAAKVISKEKLEEYPITVARAGKEGKRAPRKKIPKEAVEIVTSPEEPGEEVTVEETPAEETEVPEEVTFEVEETEKSKKKKK